MALIDHSYFIRDINLPETSSLEGQETVAYFINLYEKEFLQAILGYDLWKAFTTAIAGATPAQKWLDLRDGKEFTSLSDRMMKWEGFKNSDKISPIANYVYWHYMEFKVTNTTGIGEVKPQGENAQTVSPAFKMAAAWNRMVDMLITLNEFLDANASTYPEWDKHVFPFRKFRKVNAFGI